MSDINFCNTKEQLNHLGEVVTGKVDGSPTGSDIDTSTLTYTGQVRKTLPALEGEYEQSITNKEIEADAAIDSYRLLNKGPYASGITLESKFEYITYNGESYFATNPPYTTTATLPDADGNLLLGGYTTFENVANKIGNKNELSNSNFLTPSPDEITHPNVTPESYIAGTQIFSGVYAGDSGCTVTFIDGRVNCTAGDYQFKLPNTGGLERVPVFTSSVSDYDGIPKITGVSHALVGDEYVVTVTPAAGDVFSVKLEQGSVATRHEVELINSIEFTLLTDVTSDNVNDGNVVSTKARSEHTNGQGGYTYRIDSQSGYTPNGGTVVDLGDGLLAIAITRSGSDLHTLKGAHIDAALFNVKLNGLESFAESKLMIDWAESVGGVEIDMGVGIHEMGDNNYPLRNELSDSLRDMKNIKLKCHGDQTIIRTTSSDGADVLQVNALKNASVVGFPRIEATLTDTQLAGSNGVSITNGFENLEFEVNCVDLPFVEYPTYGDGGKAFSIQPGTTQNPCSVLKAKVRYNNCLYGVGADINMDNAIDNPIYGVDIDFYGEDCYRGVTLSGLEPTQSVPSTGIQIDFNIKGTSINARQHYVSSRFWNNRVDINVFDTKSKAQMNEYLVNDSTRCATRIEAGKNNDTTIKGSVSDVDDLHTIGGTNMASPNTNGATENCDIQCDVSFTSATNQLVIKNVGGNRVTKSNLTYKHVSSGLDELASYGNSVVGGSTQYMYNAKLINTFELLSQSTQQKVFGVRADGNIESTLTTSSALGAYVGKKAEYDEDGVFLGYRPLYL